MPCYDPRSDSEIDEEQRQRDIVLIKKVEQLYDGKQRAEAMLCATLDIAAREFACLPAQNSNDRRKGQND